MKGIQNRNSSTLLLSRTTDYEIPIALAFIDVEKVFDSVYHRAIIEALQGIDKPYVETLSFIVY